MFKAYSLEITNRCNLRCVHCYFSDRYSALEMPYEKIIAVLEKNKYAQSVVVSGGEPFLHSQMDLILEYLSNIKGEVILITNGTCISEKAYKTFENAPNIKFQISLDGSNAYTNSLVRTGCDFDTVIENIRILAKIDSKRVVMRMTISKLNYKDVPSFYLLAESLGVAPSFLFAAKFGSASVHWDKIQLSDSEKACVYSDVLMLNKKLGKQIPPPDSIMHCSFLDNLVIGEGCSPTVDVNGNIYLCSYFPDYIVGNVFTDDIESIRNNKTYLQLKEQVRSWSREIALSRCKNCFFVDRCDQGCYGKYIVNGRKEDDGDCGFRQYRYMINAIHTMQENNK